jgi:imidazolonepropionase-like amidohydrolase
MAAVRAGAHTIEHGSYIDDEAAELMAENGVTLVATRHVIEAGLKNLDKLNPPTAKKMVNIAESHLRAYQTAVRKGVKIALGTDIAGSDPGTDTAHGKNGHEVAYAVKAGLTPLQAIEAGTINSAETLGALAPKKGLIQKGWDADLIALEENPLDNIHLFDSPENIRYVWKGGLLVKSPQGQLLWPTTS